MMSVTEDTGMKVNCSEILELLHKNLDSVWEKATVSLYSNVTNKL